VLLQIHISRRDDLLERERYVNRSNTEQKSGSISVAASAAKTRLSGSWLIIARAVWLVLVVPSLGLFVASLPVYYQQLQTACVGPVTCNVVGALTAKGFQALSAFGFSVSGYAAFNVIFWTIIEAIWSAVGFLIFWRRSDDWFALLVVLFLVMFNSTIPGTALALVYPALGVPTSVMSVLGQVSLGVFFLLFPNGRFVPRWMGLLLLLFIIQTISAVLPFASPFNSNNWPLWLNGLLSLTIDGSIIFSQIYRYRRVSTPVERQQTKWVVLGISAVVTGFIALGLLNAFFPSLNQPDTPYYLIPSLAYPLLLLLLPLSTGVAILRYRLYDIDVLINRTLIYGSLTALLVALYVGLILALQAVVRVVTGSLSQQPLILVGSTLVIAALFQPLRRRIQGMIDRRFYRRKYDAARTLAAFSATLRNEVDLHQLREHLVTVVEETMQPTHVSLWLRTDEQRRTPHTDV
jgi:hypothetical protein